MQIIVEYWPLVVLLGFVGLAVVRWFQGERAFVKHLARAAVAEAEQLFGGGTGPIKFEFAVEYIYRSLPALVKPFVSEEKISAWIEEAVEWMKTQLRDQALDFSLGDSDT